LDLFSRKAEGNERGFYLDPRGTPVMATAIDLGIGRTADCTPLDEASQQRRRQITPGSGRALEILGHAIEYLTDQYVHERERFSADDPEVEAIQLLMSLNRQVYYECPVIPTFAERFRVFLRKPRV
jgi:hypothetical protein